MQGLDAIRSQQSKDAIFRMLSEIYDQKMYDVNQIEDIVLFTSGREDYSNIGTDSVKLSVMKYITENIFWISVCLFVNEDFRSCFDDAIAIEKMLLQVNDIEYADFRDDMTLNEKINEPDQNVGIELNNYRQEIDQAIMGSILGAEKSFAAAGMVNVYKDLIETFDKDVLNAVKYTIHNYVYIINAMNRNGIFNKYVKLVVNSVKKQLS